MAIPKPEWLSSWIPEPVYWVVLCTSDSKPEMWGVKKTPQKQDHKNKATKRGVWGMSGFGFYACRSSWSATVFGGYFGVICSFPALPKPMAVLPTALHCSVPRGHGEGLANSCWQKTLQLSGTPKHCQGTGFSLSFFLCAASVTGPIVHPPFLFPKMEKKSVETAEFNQWTSGERKNKILNIFKDMSQSKERVWIYFCLCPAEGRQRRDILVRPGWVIHKFLKTLWIWVSSTSTR